MHEVFQDKDCDGSGESSRHQSEPDEQDYARFGITRSALADILTVGPGGVALMHRKADDVAAFVPPSPRFRLASRRSSASITTRRRR